MSVKSISSVLQSFLLKRNIKNYKRNSMFMVNNNKGMAKIACKIFL